MIEGLFLIKGVWQPSVRATQCSELASTLGLPPIEPHAPVEATRLLVLAALSQRIASPEPSTLANDYTNHRPTQSKPMPVAVCATNEFDFVLWVLALPAKMFEVHLLSHNVVGECTRRSMEPPKVERPELFKLLPGQAIRSTMAPHTTKCPKYWNIRYLWILS